MMFDSPPSEQTLPRIEDVVDDAKRLAKRMWRNGGRKYVLEDFEGEALLGITVAQTKYEEGKGATWVTYALSYAKGYILRYLTEQTHSGVRKGNRVVSWRLSRGLWEGLVGEDLKKFVDRPEWSDEDLAKAVQELGYGVNHASVALYQKSKDGTSFASDLMDRIQCQESEERLAALETQEESEFLVHKLLESVEMDWREMEIVSLRLMSDDPATLEELGERFSITRERVRQIEAALLAKFRRAAEKMKGT